MPQSSTLARRYADAYFALARQAGDIEGWGRELGRVETVLGDDEVAAALANPRLGAAQRARLALDLLEGVSAPARNLARLLVERRRMGLLPGVREHYERLADRASGVIRAEVISAVELGDERRRELERVLERRLGASVKTEVRHDPSILGGLIIRLGDRVIDDSVRTHLQQLQASLA